MIRAAPRTHRVPCPSRWRSCCSDLDRRPAIRCYARLLHILRSRPAFRGSRGRGNKLRNVTGPPRILPRTFTAVRVTRAAGFPRLGACPHRLLTDAFLSSPPPPFPMPASGHRRGAVGRGQPEREAHYHYLSRRVRQRRAACRDALDGPASEAAQRHRGPHL